MPSLSSLLLRIPDEFKPLAAIGIGAIILVLMVLLHGFGLHKILVRFKRADLRLRRGRPHLGRAGVLFASSVFRMLSLHILEIFFWATALVALGLVPRPADAVYFCANAYTTLGYGTVDLDPLWRNISPIIAISGLFTLAWTTGLMVSMVQNYLQLIEKLEEERLEQIHIHSVALQQEIEALDAGKREENAAFAAAKQQASGTSFFQRRKIWKEEKLKVGQIRSEARKKARNIREQERLAEDKLGDASPHDNPEVKP